MEYISYSYTEIADYCTGFFGKREYPWDTEILSWKTIYEFDPSKESLLENNIHNFEQLQTNQ